jgi:hypothetical protein
VRYIQVLQGETGLVPRASPTMREQNKSHLQKRKSVGVEWARCAMAAVTMSPPQVSSMFIAMPALTARSRTARALVSPPTYSTRYHKIQHRQVRQVLCPSYTHRM